MVNIAASTSEPISVQLYSLLGSASTEEIVFNGTTYLDLNGLNSGIYLLKFVDANGSVKIEKLVIE